MSPLVSVIIPCYNQGQYIEDAVKSIIAQSFTNWEIIIVDDCSTDDSCEPISRLLSAKIKAINHTVNKGVSAARNTAINSATGEYILPLDADDMIDPSFLSTCVPLIKQGVADIIYTDARLFGSHRGTKRLPNYKFVNYKKRNQFCCTALYHKIHWEEVGGYNELFLAGYEDWEFGINMGEHGHFGHRVPKPLFRYRQKPISRNTSARENEGGIWELMFKLHPIMKTWS